MTAIGALLLAARRAKGLTKYRVEQEVGVPHMALYRVEGDRGFLEVGTLDKLCTLYDLDLAECVTVMENDRAVKALSQHMARKEAA